MQIIPFLGLTGSLGVVILKLQGWEITLLFELSQSSIGRDWGMW